MKNESLQKDSENRNLSLFMNVLRRDLEVLSLKIDKQKEELEILKKE